MKCQRRGCHGHDIQAHDLAEHFLSDEKVSEEIVADLAHDIQRAVDNWLDSFEDAKRAGAKA